MRCRRWISSEASKPASAGGCATGRRTWARHVYDFVSASRPFYAGSATAFGSAFAPCNGSDLLTLRLLFAHKPAVSFLTSPAFWKVFTGLAAASCPPRLECSLCPAFRRLSFGGLRSRGTARVTRSVLIHSSNPIPSGVTAIHTGPKPACVT